MKPLTGLVLVAASLASIGGALALTPWPRESIVAVPAGSAPFVGNWSMAMAGRPVTTYATCKLPVRIEAADDSHIFYRGPKDAAAEAATELVTENGRTRWLPIAGGPQYFAVWVDADRFHLYDLDVEAEADWGEPYAFTRCE